MTKIEDVLNAIDETLTAWEGIKIDHELTEELIAEGKTIIEQLKAGVLK